ncbi:MAG TPA: hypothetical protein DG753_00580 [Clostridium sp.]|nr:hypothetical protein [Clostridium sp.]
MSCRCSEVREYTKQLFKLISAKGCMDSVVNNSKDTKGFIKKSGDKFKSAIVLNTAETFIGEELSEGYNEAVSQCNEAYEEVTKAIKVVSDKLKSYREEDRSWHSRKHNSR